MTALGLSSNWKKLQQTLKNDHGEKKTLKRKRTLDAEESVSKAVRKTRKEISLKAKTGSTANKMGLNTSKPDYQPTARNVMDEPRHGEPRSLSRKSSMASTRSKNETTVEDSATLVNQGPHPSNRPGKYLSLDCEMVGTGPPPSLEHVLARVSIVNYHGQQIYDSFVQPVTGVNITDYRTFVSGVRPTDLRVGYARPYNEVQRDVAALLKDKILVGHAVQGDLDVLMLSHPKRDTRDTSRYPKYRALSGGRPPALRKLARDVLGMDIQTGEHSSVEDARATMSLFSREKAGFEAEVRRRWGSAMMREKQKPKEINENGRRGSDTAVVVATKSVEANIVDGDLSEADKDEGDEVGDTARKRRKKRKKRSKR